MPEEPKKITQEQIKEPGFEVSEVGVERKPEEAGRVPEKPKIEKEEVGALPSEKPGEAVAPSVVPAKSGGLIKIEEILEEDLGDVYFDMPEDKKQKFKKQGEETAQTISLLMQETTIKVKKILRLITNWLKIIPGINKFFLEQEAKIKTDKILGLRK